MPTLALIDGNNFYCACERVFNPALNGVPVIVLSNNDGCAVARSNEAKKLGVKMGTPLFQMLDLVRRHGIRVLSSNYTLYGDLSRRMMAVIGQFSPLQEIYSIDECFLDFTGIADVRARVLAVRRRVQQWVGIPVCVGIGPSKTLAKLANHIAKKGLHPKAAEGVFDYTLPYPPRNRTLSLAVSPLARYGASARAMRYPCKGTGSLLSRTCGTPIRASCAGAIVS